MAATPGAMRGFEERLRDVRDWTARGLAANENLEGFEERLRAALDAVGQELMRAALNAENIDAPEVWINGVHHTRVRSFDEEVHTTFGPVVVRKSTYRKDSKTAPVAAIDKKLGLVEGRYTPKTGKVLSLLTALVVREDVEKIIGEFGGMRMGGATMYRVPQVIMARYEVARLEVDPQVRERDRIPAEAAIVQVGLDGVMVPQEGEHCDPRGRTPKGDPEPPRHEQAVGTLGSSPRDEDGTTGVAWHEASVGTVAFFDKEGEHLETRYIGRMPEAYKATLEEMLTAEAQYVADNRPDLQLVLASDGAEGQWESLKRLRAALPGTMGLAAIELLDLFHLAEHLQEAANAIYGTGSPRGRVMRAAWVETIKAYEDGFEQVRQALRRVLREATVKTTKKVVSRVLNYMKANRLRASYAAAAAKNLPLATGPTEAAAKSLVGVRMKRSGARYSQHGGQTILTLLAAHKSDRFNDLWNVIVENCYAANVTHCPPVAA